MILSPDIVHGTNAVLAYAVRVTEWAADYADWISIIIKCIFVYKAKREGIVLERKV